LLEYTYRERAGRGRENEKELRREKEGGQEGEKEM
jgi:hypothetical protein